MLAVSLVAGTFILLRKIERWLHQHIFKVGWLLTHDYRTTTILYYAFFFPGVLLHELTYWLMAGMLNVSAERAIKWPEPQEVGELKLNFVRISPKAGIYRRAIITATPLLVALGIIWLVANNVFDLAGAARIMSTGDVEDVAAGFRHLTSAPDFWLWVYLLFTISNTMYPPVPKDLQGWRTIAGAVGIVIALTFVIGIGHDVLQLVGEPISQFLTVLQGILIFIICINVFMTMVLGAMESVIERVTGHSATFKRGKMITMTREEAVAQRRKDRERQRKQQALTTTTRRPAEQGSMSSVYALMLPVPGGPDEEVIAVPVFKIEPEAKPALPYRSAVSPRLGAEVVTLGEAPSTAPALPQGQKSLPAASGETKSTSTQKAVSEDQVDEAVQMLRINTPASRNAPPPEAPVPPAEIDKAVETFRASAPPSAPAPDKPSDTEKPASRPWSTPASGSPSQPPKPFGTDKPVTSTQPASSFGTPKPTPPQTDEDDDSALLRPFDPPAAAKPTAPASTGFNRPGSPFGTPKPILPQTDEDDDDSALLRPFDPPAAAKPTVPASTGFNRPASPFGTPKPTPPQADDEDDDLDSFRQPPAAAKPTAPASTPFNRPGSPFGTPKPTPPQADEDEDDLDSFRQPPAAAKPTAPASTPFNRPGSPFGTPKPTLPQADDEDDLDSFRQPPAAARPTAPANTPFNRPAAPFGTPKPASADESDLDSSKPIERPAASAKPKDPEKGVPFNRPPSPFGTLKSDDDDNDDLGSFRQMPPAAAKPSTPFGTPKPTPPQSDDDLGSLRQPPAAAKPKDPEKGVPFNRPASPFDFPKPAGDDEDEDEDLSAFRKIDRTVVTKANTPFRPGSPFGAPKPDSSDDDSASPKPTERPAAWKPSGPSPSFGTPKADDTSRQPNRPAFGAPSSASAKPISPYGSKPDDSKSSIPPAASGPRPGAFTPPPRFGTKPPTPAPKPSTPFGRKPDDEDESIMDRLGSSARDATDDLFEDLKRPDTPTTPLKRTTNTQPIIGSGSFGTSRPVPKKASRPEDDEDDEMDDLRDTIRYEDEDLRYSDDDDVVLPGDDD